MARQACNYSQHLPGRLNVIADCLSRDFHLSDDQLISMLTSLHPSLSHTQIKIINLPQKHISWVASLARRWPGTRESPKALIKSTIAAGISGWVSPCESNSMPTPIWKDLTKLADYASAVHSCMQCDEVILGEVDNKSNSEEILRERPSTMWQRPLWQVVGAAPSSTQEAGPTPTSNDRQEGTEETTQPPSTKNPYPQ